MYYIITDFNAVCSKFVLIIYQSLVFIGIRCSDKPLNRQTTYSKPAPNFKRLRGALRSLGAFCALLKRGMGGWAVVLLLSLVIGGQSLAQWSRDPSEALRLPEDYYGYQLVSDSLGGVFISAWGGYYRTYCYHIDANG